MRTGTCVGLVVLAGCVAALGKEPARIPWPEDDFSWIRGANYNPSYAGGSVELWDQFDPAVVDRELGYAARAGLNSVRVFLHVVVYEKDPTLFLDRFEQFLVLCNKHAITMMPVLFDAVGGEPSPNATGWRACPGLERVCRTSWPRCETYVRDVVRPYVGDPRIALWDVMNEPMMGPKKDDGRKRQQTWRFVRHFVELVNELDATHATTVGVADGQQDLPHVVDFVRTLSFHSYRREASVFREQIRSAKELGTRHGRAVFVSEMGHYGTGQFYPMAVRVCREENIGYYFWELMVGQSPFAGVTGIFYPDGTVRSTRDVAALLGFESAPPFQQRYPFRFMEDVEMISAFREGLAADTNPWNVERRLGFLQSAKVVDAVARKRLAPRDERPHTASPQDYLDKVIAVAEEFKAVQNRARQTLEAGDAPAAYAAVDKLLRGVAAELNLETE